MAALDDEPGLALGDRLPNVRLAIGVTVTQAIVPCGPLCVRSADANT